MTKDELRKALDFVCEERDRLQNTIDKAIEYIKKHIEKCHIDGYEGKFDNFDIFTKPQELIDILEGKEC